MSVRVLIFLGLLLFRQNEKLNFFYEKIYS